LAISEEAFNLLVKYNTTIIECGLPVAAFEGAGMSEAIRKAHSVASQSGLTDEQFLTFYAHYRPNFLIHLQDNQRKTVAALTRQTQGLIDAVMTDSLDFYADLSSRRQSDAQAPRVVQFVSALSEHSLQSLACEEDALIYLGCASQTGGELLPSAVIESAVDSIAAVAPGAKILCGLGIRSAHDVARIRDIQGVHGVAIGTEAIHCLAQGMAAFEHWLIDINQACSPRTQRA
jgi:tryptophan synthase alpha subunit